MRIHVIHFFNTHYLNKSFRNSKNITEFANAILAPYFKNKKYVPEAFNRETSKPTVLFCNNDDNRVKSIVSRMRKNYVEDKNIAIIVKTIIIPVPKSGSNMIRPKTNNIINKIGNTPFL